MHDDARGVEELGQSQAVAGRAGAHGELKENRRGSSSGSE
jgi:hypothetical protein